MTISQLQIGTNRYKDGVSWRDVQPIPNVSYKSLEIFAELIGKENFSDHYSKTSRNISKHRRIVDIWSSELYQREKKMMDKVMALYVITLVAGPCYIAYDPKSIVLVGAVMTVGLIALSFYASVRYDTYLSSGYGDNIHVDKNFLLPLTAVPEAWDKTRGKQQKYVQDRIDKIESKIQKHLPLLKSSLDVNKELISTKIDSEINFLCQELEKLNPDHYLMSDIEKKGGLLNRQIRDYRAAIVELGKLCEFFSLG